MTQDDETGLPDWEVRNLKNAYQERRPTEYVVDKFFATESLNVVYGAPGVMKSMVIADMCCAVVAGERWLPGAGDNAEGIPTNQGAILWYDVDNGTRRTDERFDALAKSRKLPEDAPLYYISMPMRAFFATDVDMGLYLMGWAQDLDAKIIVFDNLGLITGDVEENSAGMAQVMGGLRVIAERTGAAVIAIHHQRKGGAAGSRAGDALRGHSSIEASLDLALHVVREPDTLEIKLQSTKTRGVDVPTTSAVFNYEHRTGTHDLRRAWFHGVQRTAAGDPIKVAVLEALALADGGAMTQGRLVDQVYDALNQEMGKMRIRNWIKELTNSRPPVLRAQKGLNNANIISCA